jgi:hypothetical protein
MIKIVGTEFIPSLGNGRPENGTGIFVEALMCFRKRGLHDGELEVTS